jgi:linoleoyl-CoA desaturase
MSQKLKFVDREGSEFFSTLKKRVDSYFKEQNLSKNANSSMLLKSAFFLSLMVILYLLILSNSFPLPILLLFAVLLGMTKAFIGFNVCHDAIHGSYSSNTKVNKGLSLVFNLIGANAYVWSITHNIVHHTYTNIPGHDEDIEVAPGLLRISPDDKIKRIQRYQHIYAFFLYSLASLSWVFRKDYKKFFQKKIGNYDDLKHPRREYFNLFFFKFVYYVLFIVIPLIVLDASWWQFLIGFILMHMAEGLVLGLVFQLAHVVEGTDFPSPDEKGNIEEAWAIHQMRTTANFARKSKLACFLCGGLNMQVEHHLFPKICHIHYPVVSEIVKRTAEEFNVPYNEQPSFFSALKSHYLILKKMGRESIEFSRKKISSSNLILNN